MINCFLFTAASLGKLEKHENKSSPSHIITTQMSSIWLHWNYTWGGDAHSVAEYQYQSITYKSRYGSTPVELARRKDQFSTIKKLSSISDPIGARIDVISNNSTLVVHNLQYNDSGSNFSSFVQIGYDSATVKTNFILKPVVTIDVQGELRCV